MTLVAPKRVIISRIQDPYNSKQPCLSTLAKDDHMDTANVPRKRKRLTHLSPDERLMRRKLKNRVAAQTARDRKKERMDYLEEALAQLEAENRNLQNENDKLKLTTDTLVEENQSLRHRLVQDNDAVLVDPVLDGCASSESAALCSPLQQERTRTILHLTTHCLAFLLTISLTRSWDSSSKSPIWLMPQLRRKLKQLEHSPLRPTLSPKLLKHLQDKWWGPQQTSWNPSRN